MLGHSSLHAAAIANWRVKKAGNLEANEYYRSMINALRMKNSLYRKNALNRTAFAVVMAYVFLISVIISPLKSVFSLTDAMLAGGTVLCLTDSDGAQGPLKDQKHSHQSDCCVVCGRLDLVSPVMGDVLEVLAIPTRLPSETMRFVLFQSRAPPDLILREALGQDPPRPA